MTAGEAMSCGKPVVATAVGSLPEVVVDGETGVLCRLGDPAELSQSILRILRDPDLADAMGRAGAARVERLFRWDRVAQRTLELYGKVLDLWRACRERR